MGIPDHLTCLLRNLYAGQEATVRTGHGTIDWFQIGKGVCQGCILSLCLFHFYAEYIMRTAGLEETQAGIRIAGRNINHLRYADDTTCRGPAWGTLPMAKVMRKEAWHTQKRDQASGNPLFPSIYPITISLGERVNVQLQGNKNSWAWQECFSLRTPLKVN